MLKKLSVAIKSDLCSIKELMIPIISITIVGMGLGAIMPVLAILYESRGWSASLIGMNSSFASLAILVFPICAVYIFKYMTPSRVLIFANLCAGCLIILLYWVENIALAFLLRFVVSFFVTAIFLISEYWISLRAPAEKRGLYLGLYATCLAIGFAIGPFLAMLFSPLEPTVYFVISTILLFGCLPFFLSTTKAPTPVEEKPKNAFKEFFIILHKCPVAIFTGIVFAVMEFGLHAVLPVYGLANDMGAKGATSLVGGLAIGFIFLQLPLGILADRINKTKLIIAISLWGAISVLFLPFWIENILLSSLIAFSLGLAAGGLYVLGLALLAESFSPDELIHANIAFVTAYGVGAFIGPSVLGFAIDIYPEAGLPIMTALMLLFIVIIGLRSKVKTI